MSSPRYMCCYGLCTKKGITSSKKKPLSSQNKFVRFPSSKIEREKCERWVSACGRDNFSLADLTKSSQICYRHFEGFQGPTKENPDPIPFISLGIKLNPTNPSSTQKPEFNLKNISNVIGWSTEIFENKVKFCKLSKGSAILECTITVNKEVIVESIGNRMNLQSICPNFVLNNNEDIYTFLNRLNKYNVCCGNPDPDLVDYFRKQSRHKKGYYSEEVKSIYSEDCHRLIPARKKRCHHCARYRGCLRKLRSVKKTKALEKQKKGKSVINKHKSSLQNREKTKAAISAMREIFKNKLDMEPTGSFGAIFIRQQLKAMDRSKYGMRWDKTFLKWCCYLKNKSASSYEALRKSGCLYLPSTRTLYDEAHVVTSKSGFNEEVFIDMIRKTKLQQRPNWDRYFLILLDEMKIKEDLACHKNTGFLTGLKDINKDLNILNDMKREISGVETPPLATQVLQLMLRGITNNIKIPFAHFPSTGVSSSEIYFILQEAIEKLEIHGFRILGIVGDGCSANRKYFKMCAQAAGQIQEDNSAISFKVPNLFANDEERDIYFLSDAPHLIKTTRNCFYNSSKESKVRQMWKNHENISWDVIIKLYYYQLRQKGEFKHVPKLTYGHVYLNSYAKMKVNYAVQVLSETVASAIENCFGKEKYPETVKFIRVFNKFFDICNVKNCKEGFQRRNEDKAPFRSINDERLKWLEYDFIKYLDDWKTNVFCREGEYTAMQRAKMLLSHETIDGLKMTARSTVGIVKFLLSKGAPYVLTQHLNQDPLEQYFGRMRSAGGRNNNPSVWLYQSNIDKLESLKGFVLEAIGGNTKIV